MSQIIEVIEAFIELIGLQFLIDNTLTTKTCVLYYIISVFSQIAKYRIEKTTHHKHIISRNIKLILLQADALNSKAIVSSKIGQSKGSE